MADKHDRERFIPFRKADIVDMCIKDSGLADGEKTEFREFAHILESLFHFEIEDAMQKLLRLELIARDGDLLEAKPLPEAKKQLDDIWDNYFNFNNS